MTSSPEPYASAAAVAGLARELEALRRAVEPLRGLPERVEQLVGLLAELAEATAADGPPPPARTPSWLDLPADAEPADAAGLLDQLVDWMRGIFLRYTDAARALPDCWLWHPDVVEELVWLRTAWWAAYRMESGTVQLAADWHDRHRPGVVRRIRDYAGTCSLETHLPGAERHSAAAVPLADAVPAIADWWALGRDQPPPAPTAEQLARCAGPRRPSRPRGRP
jgi:hypothetical protein